MTRVSVISCIRRRLGSCVLIAIGLLSTVASISLESKNTVIASCGSGYICGCYTDNVYCSSGCVTERCIWETGMCTQEIMGMHPFCGFSFCDPVCGVGGL